MPISNCDFEPLGLRYSSLLSSICSDAGSEDLRHIYHCHERLCIKFNSMMCCTISIICQVQEVTTLSGRHSQLSETWTVLEDL
jgi:hypothetical protein